MMQRMYEPSLAMTDVYFMSVLLNHAVVFLLRYELNVESSTKLKRLYCLLRARRAITLCLKYSQTCR